MLIGRRWALAGCSDRDGRFSCGEVLALMEAGFQRTRLYQPHEFSAQLSGWCTLQLYRTMVDVPGQAAAVDWCAPCTGVGLHKGAYSGF